MLDHRFDSLRSLSGPDQRFDSLRSLSGLDQRFDSLRSLSGPDRSPLTATPQQDRTPKETSHG